jgi:hypothetical protein
MVGSSPQAVVAFSLVLAILIIEVVDRTVKKMTKITLNADSNSNTDCQTKIAEKEIPKIQTRHQLLSEVWAHS